MAAAKQISRADEILMIVVVVLGENAYSTTIRQELYRRARKKVTVGSLWVSLDQLAERGYIRKRVAAKESGRGGRPRVFYAVTKRGIKSLERAQVLQKKIWMGVADLETYAS